VLLWADVSGLKKSDAIRHFTDGLEQTHFERVAIARYPGESRAYLFHCDGEWRVANDDLFDSVGEAIREATRQYEGLSETAFVLCEATPDNLQCGSPLSGHER